MVSGFRDKKCSRLKEGGDRVRGRGMRLVTAEIQAGQIRLATCKP